MKFLTIVPSTGKRSKWLKSCLESLKRQTHYTDVNIALEYGLSHARNVSVKNNLDKYDAFAFIDDDAIADERWIEELERSLAVYDIIGGLILPKYEKPPPFWFSSSLHPFIAINPVSHHIYGCNFAVKKEVFEAGHFFREDLGRASDNLAVGEESCFLRNAGKEFKIGFCEKTVVHHIIPKEKLSAQYILKRFFWEGKSNAIWHGKKQTVKYHFCALIKNLKQLRFLPFHLAYFGGALSE